MALESERSTKLILRSTLETLITASPAELVDVVMRDYKRMDVYFAVNAIRIRAASTNKYPTPAQIVLFSSDLSEELKMPIYEYHCSQCDSDVEILVRASETATCPECGSIKLDKQLSVTASPTIGNSNLPTYSPPAAGTCGKPQCGTGCMNERRF